MSWLLMFCVAIVVALLSFAIGATLGTDAIVRLRGWLRTRRMVKDARRNRLELACSLGENRVIHLDHHRRQAMPKLAAPSRNFDIAINWKDPS